MAEIFGLEFFRNALLAGLLLGAFSAVLGILVVLKRTVFVGAALAEVSSAGIALAFFLGFTGGPAPVLFSLVLTLAAVAAFANPARSRVLPPDSRIAALFVGAGAISILLVSQSAEGFEEVHHLVGGNILTVTRQEVLLSGLATVALGTVLVAFHRRLVFTAFDPEMAESLGIPARRWSLVFFLLLGATLSLSIRSLGTLLAFGYLVLPPMTGLLAFRRILPATVTSAGAAVTATLAGLFVSVAWDLPASPAIVALLTVILSLVSGGTRLLRRA